MRTTPALVVLALSIAASHGCSNPTSSSTTKSALGAQVQTVSATAPTGFDITSDDSASGYTLYVGSPSLWGNLQTGGYVEYKMDVLAAGAYAVQLYYSTTLANQSADIEINGSTLAVASLPSTGSWGTFTLSSGVSVHLPAGDGTLRLAGVGTNPAFNLEGLLLTPVSTSAPPSPPTTPVTPPAPPLAGSAIIDWTDVHQVIDGFGGSNAFASASMSTANQNLFFGTGAGQLGLSILRVAVPDDAGVTGNCASVGTSCAGATVGDMKAAVANGARVIGTPWSPPASYKTNGSIDCTNNSAPLAAGSYAAYATWLANFVESLQAQGVNLYAISIQNEPDTCQSYDSATWTSANYDTFVKSNLGPTFAANALSTLIMLPEAGIYSQTSGYDADCGADITCVNYVAGINWHDYDAVLTGTNTVQADPYPSNFPAGKKYWETEASCPGATSVGCASGFTTDIGDALRWGAVVDQRLAVDGANAWLYWWLQSPESTDNEGLINSDNVIAKRAYMLGQYGKFVRPGYNRIDATHLPHTGVSVTAFRDPASNTLVIVATNYTTAAVSQAFTVSNAPAFTSVTPTTTSATLSLSQQAAVPVTGNSFTYSLPAQSITTFVGN